MGSGEGRHPVAHVLLRAAAATWGLAVAVAIFASIRGPAHPGQLPGILRLLNINARAPFLLLALLAVLPPVAAWLLRPLVSLFDAEDTRAWARNAAIASMIVPMWLVSIEPNSVWAIVPTAFALAALLILRRFDAAFGRRDAILLPVFGAVVIALFDLTRLEFQNAVIVAAAIVIAIRIAVSSADCFALAPLALVPECSFFAGNRCHAGWPALAIAIGTPFVIRALPRLPLRRALAYAILPIAAYAYGSATSLMQAEGKPRADLFECAHTIVPGAEMLRGKQLYRDIIPAHGLISDALLSYAALRGGPVTIGHALAVRLDVERLNRPAEYFVALGITGSPEVSIAAFFLGEVLGTSVAPLRVIPALIVLAFAAAAVRRRRPSLLAAAGAFVAIALVTGTDFGAYAAITAVAAALLIRRQRLRGLVALAAGAIGAAMVIVIAAGWTTIAGFLHFTFSATGRLVEAYALPPLTIPVSVTDRRSLLVLAWFAVVIGLAASLAFRIRKPRYDALRLAAMFMVICGISYAERHHAYFQYALAPLIASLIFFAPRRIAPVLAVVALAIAWPPTHFALVAEVRRARGPLEPGLREVSGAWFNSDDANAIDAVRGYVNARLQPGDTFFDFTNRGALYFLLDRDCPIRFLEPAFYEPEELQREVIAAIDSNPHVRAALIPPPNPSIWVAVDGVPNRERAPLVRAYLQQHFEPDFADGNVVIWRRK